MELIEEHKRFIQVAVLIVDEKVIGKHEVSKKAYIATNLNWSSVSIDQVPNSSYACHGDHRVGFPVFRSSPPSP